MSRVMTIHASRGPYEVQFTDDYQDFLARHVAGGNVAFVDATVQRLYGDRLAHLLAEDRTIVVQPSEKQKSFDQLSPFILDLVERGFRRDHRLIAIGGGITQDVTGFIASVLYRGVEWIFYPTTLLAQCDSCIGSKTSINFGRYKNQLGTFHPPSEIVIDTSFLRTLPEVELRSGLGEMMHYYLLSGRTDYLTIAELCDTCLSSDEFPLSLLKRSLEIKRSLIEIDEFDVGERRVFNYGHSFGHAIETLTDFRVPHGIAVCYGMDIANFISMKKGLIPRTLREEIRATLAKIWRGVDLGEIDVDEYASALRKDKKNVGQEVRVVLTEGLGGMFVATLSMDAQTIAWLEEYFNGSEPEL